MYSNCLIEALKAKIKNPKVHIFKASKEFSERCHFMWKDGDSYFHAREEGKESNFFTFFWHKVQIRKVPDYIFDSFLSGRIATDSKQTKEKVAKLTDMKFAKLGKDWDWYLAGDEFISPQDLAYFKKVMKTEPKFKVFTAQKQLSVLDYSELSELLKKEEVYSKMIDLFDNDFNIAYLGTEYVKKREI